MSFLLCLACRKPCISENSASTTTLQRTHKTILKQKLWEQKIAKENKVHRSQEMRCNTWCNKGGLHVLPSLWILGRAAFQCQNKVLSTDTADLWSKSIIYCMKSMQHPQKLMADWILKSCVVSSTGGRYWRLASPAKRGCRRVSSSSSRTKLILAFSSLSLPFNAFCGTIWRVFVRGQDLKACAWQMWKQPLESCSHTRE